MNSPLDEEEKKERKSIDAWKIFRIMSEFVDGFETLTDLGPSVSVFGSARYKTSSPYYKMAQDVGEKIASKGFAVITGGGPGLMAAVNKGAEIAGGKSAALRILLPFEEEKNPYVSADNTLNFRYFFVRKVMFVRYAQAFVALPGGLGTMDELLEAMTLIQTEKIRSFPIYLMGKDYWKGLVDWLRQTAIKEKTLAEEDIDLIKITDDPDFVANDIQKYFKAKHHFKNF